MTSFNCPRTFGRLAALCSLATAMLTTAVAANPAEAMEDLVVNYDQSQLLKLSRPASEIIIGNPAIADVTVQSGNLLVVTGKTFGITNMIVLDHDRNVIQEQRILVKRDEAKVLNLIRGRQRQSYNCTPQCNPSIMIGDDTDYFDNISKASEKKMGFSEKAADPTMQSGGQ